MKILYYSPHPHINSAAPSGPGTHIREVIQGMESNGHKVIRLIAGGETLENSGASIQFKKRSWKKWIPAYVWQTLKDFQLKRYDKSLEARLRELIQKEKPDFIYERAYYLMSSGQRIAREMGVDYACEINAPYPEEKSAMSGKSFFYKQAIRNERAQVLQSKRVFVVSSALRDYLEKNIAGSRSKIIITPNAVRPEQAEKDPVKRDEIRLRLNIPSESLVIGFVGSIFPYHGVDNLIEAFAILSKAHKRSMHLLVVGDGEVLGQLKSRAKDILQDGSFTFTGNVPHGDVYHYISLMDITVMARSNWYGSPVKIFEYGLMQKSIIAPDVIPVRDVMTDGEDGILISDSQQSLQKALERLIDSPELAGRMALSFYKKVIGHHTWKKVSATITDEMS